MTEYKTLQEGLLARDLWATQDLFPDTKRAVRGDLRIIAKLKVPGGIRQGIWWEESSGDGSPAPGPHIRERTKRFDRVSDRPFIPGDRCDGSRDACAWACLWDAVRRSDESSGQLMEDLNRIQGAEILTDAGRRVCIQEGAWEGIVLPRRWTRDWLDRLMRSQRSMNRRTLVNLLCDRQPGGGQDTSKTWIDRLTQEDTRLAQSPSNLEDDAPSEAK